MAATVTKNRNFDKKINEKIMKNPLKIPFAKKLLVNDAFMIPFKNYG